MTPWRSMPAATRQILLRGIGLGEDDCYEIRGMLDLTGLRAISELDRPDLVAILLEEAVAQHTQGVGISGDLLHQQIVVFAGFDERAILPKCMADRRETAFIRFGERSDPRSRLASILHGKLDKGIPGAGGRRRPEHLDICCRQILVDVLPGPVRICDEIAVRFPGRR